MNIRFRLSWCAVWALCAAPVLAQPVTDANAARPMPLHALSLAASATQEVAQDLLSVTLSVLREGSDPAAVQGQVRQALDAALSEARKAARPQQLDVRTGAFALNPRYSQRGPISGWVGQAELTLEGRDMQAIAQLAARLPTMTVARVVHSLSREAREKAEGELAAQAIARFRAKADDYARLFGYAGWQVREVQVGAADAPVPMPMPRMRVAAAAAADESIPVEAGRTTVTLNVSGQVQMTR